MTTIHSRRSIVAGLAAAPVLSLPALAIEHPDAALIEAGREFDLTVELFADAQRRSKPNWEAWDREKRRLSAIAGDNHIPDAVYLEAWERVDREYPIAYPTCDDVADLMDAPFRIIVTTPAKTPEGAAAKAKVVRWNYHRLWEQSADELDADQQALRALVEAVEDMAVQS